MQEAKYEGHDRELEPDRVMARVDGHRPVEGPQAVRSDRDRTPTGSEPFARRPGRSARASGAPGPGSPRGSFCSPDRLPVTMSNEPKEATMRNQSERTHAGGDTPGDGPQHETGADGGQVDDRLMLKPEAVDRGDDDVQPDDQGQPVTGQPPGQCEGRGQRAPSPQLTAIVGDTTPEATGRYRLVGWRRSLSASMVSLRKYVPEAATQKIPKAPRALRKASPWVRTPAAPGATKTNRFLIHWRGRAMRTRPGRTASARAPAVVGRALVGWFHGFGRRGHGALRYG